MFSHAPKNGKLTTTAPRISSLRNFTHWRTPAGHILLLLVVALIPIWPAPPLGAQTVEVGGIDLSPAVQRSLGRLQNDWQLWATAFTEGDRQQAETALESLRNVASFLGMTRLPDLSVAAAALAVQAAEAEDFERADWALEAARTLDPLRPEIKLAEAQVQQLRGDFLGAFGSQISAHLLLLREPRTSVLWRQNLGVWAVYMLILSGGLFVILLMTARGSALFFDLGRLLSPPIPRSLQDPVAALLLIWPLILPSGILWLALYWAILLWGYCKPAEKVVLVLLWAVIGTAPLITNHQRRQAQLELMPPTRAMENLASGQLSSTLFSDLDTLRTLVPDDPTVTEIIADLHRRFRQWDSAERIYTGLYEDAEDERLKGPARNNLGVYYHRKGEYDTAIEYFSQATAFDSRLAAAWFNLSEAYAKTYNFDQSHSALGQAKTIDAEAVEAWQESVAETGGAVAVDGGLLRAGELRNRLAGLGRSAEDPVDTTSRFFSLAVAVGALLLALLFELLLGRRGHPSARYAETVDPGALSEKLRRAFIPGWASLQSGNGALAFFGVLVPAALLAVPLTRMAGYRASLGFDPGQGILTLLALALLVLIFILRTVLAFRKTSA